MNRALTFHESYYLGHCILRRYRYQYMYMIYLKMSLQYPALFLQTVLGNGIGVKSLTFTFHNI